MAMPTVGEEVLPPQIGMLATVRNRRGIVTAVEPFDGSDGRLHLVHVEYTDPDGPMEDQLVWEREPGATVMSPAALPGVPRMFPMDASEFDALVRAMRWTALSPFLDPDGGEGPLSPLPFSSPLHGAIQVEDFQLVPLLKAIRMPRVTLLLADDVGLGKTIEAGLILTELLLRRRVRRVLILCPASLRTQWQQEMLDKFSLSFDIVDRESTHALRKQLGLDANPWRSFFRIITSYHYLKQGDVMEQFRAACRVPSGSPHLPWDLLVVDEAHNLSPSHFGEESDLSKMLGLLSPRFEHKLFLTATPHNGHTRSFSGLLERLDPVRFSRKGELSPAERARVSDVLVRRLKREINEQTTPPRFAERHPQAISLALSGDERGLSTAFEAFRRRVHELIRQRDEGENRAGAFAVEILGKRLLSCPVVFADSWYRYQDGLRQAETADAVEVAAAERAVREDLDDDGEAESRTAHAASTVGAWLKPLADDLDGVSRAIESALERLGLGRSPGSMTECLPRHDARLEALFSWVDEHLRVDGQWRDDERLIVFTEYKTTLDYVEARLKAKYGGDDRIRVLYGGPDVKRDPIKNAFNDPADPVRILVATDAASEGLNLQETARFLLHFDVPWNPSRLEQRNGRLDRHGQARDVHVYHFASDDDADLRFLAYVVRKAHTIREDLGSAGEIFDAAFQRRFVHGHNTDELEREVEAEVDRAVARVDLPRDRQVGVSTSSGTDELARLEALKHELDLSPDTLKDTLEVALGIGVGLPRLEGPDPNGRSRLVFPVPTQWQSVVDDTLRLRSNGSRGALPALVFDPAFFIDVSSGRPVYRPSKDTTLLHLGHPMFHRALASFARARFPGTDVAASRWLVRRGGVPTGLDALLYLTIEELAVNELRETFHHWVRTLRLPVTKNRLGAPLPHQAAGQHDEPTRVTEGTQDVDAARRVWEEIEVDLKEYVRHRADELTVRLRAELEQRRLVALTEERERFQSRQGELSKLMEQQSIQRLEKEIETLMLERAKGHLWDEDRVQRLAQTQRGKEEELQLRRRHYGELREQLSSERDRVLDRIVPQRHTLRGDAQVLPVAVEIRLP